MFFAFFMCSSFLQQAKLHIEFMQQKWAKNWQRVGPSPSLSKQKFREKTGSGKSGKNPDIKFLLFWVRYQEWILQMIVLWCNEFFFVIYTNYYIFEVTIFSPICTNSKNFPVIWDKYQSIISKNIFSYGGVSPSVRRHLKK